MTATSHGTMIRNPPSFRRPSMSSYLALLLLPSALSAFQTVDTATTRKSIQTLLASSSNSNNIKQQPSTQYDSPATLHKLIQGKQPAEELRKLSHRMNLSHNDMAIVLQRKLQRQQQAATNNNEASLQVKYIQWMLLGESERSAVDASNNKATAETNAKKKTPPSRTKVATVKEETEQTFATDTLFQDRTDLHFHSKRALTEVMNLTRMTEIQAKTFEPTTRGRDILGRARTGTGKTVAFLLPSIERLCQFSKKEENIHRRTPGRIGMLIVSPTRELATQIATQAQQLTTFHNDLQVQVMYGGTNTKRDVTALKSNLSVRNRQTILVATPGRLNDHLQSTKIQLGQNNDNSPLLNFGKDIMSQTPLVVLDETDRLLDMGFRREIQKILDFLPSSHARQTLLFSATIPRDLKTIMKQHMKPNYQEVDCIQDGDAATHTNARVEQSHVILPRNSGRFVSSVVEIVRLACTEGSETSQKDHKVVVFFPTARLVNLFAEMFQQLDIVSLPVWELHSKKSQSYRNRVSETFRKATRGVLFTSDVSARGVDYPNVSHVIQFGIPESREQYIHRLGRTGRAGTYGKGWLVLSEWEASFLGELKGVDIPADNELIQLLGSPISSESQSVVEEVQRRVRTGDKVLSKSAKGAYQAFLGYYLGQMKRMKMRRKEELVDIANEFAGLTGLEETPSLTRQLVGKMGLNGVSGLNISGSSQSSRLSNRDESSDRRRNGSRSFRGQSRRGR